MNDITIIVICLYLLIWAFGAYFLWKAYRVGIKNDLRYVKGPYGHLLKHQQKHAKSFAVTELVTGLAIISFAVAIPLLTIEMRAWGSFFLVIGMTRLLKLRNLLKQDET